MKALPLLIAVILIFVLGWVILRDKGEIPQPLPDNTSGQNTIPDQTDVVRMDKPAPDSVITSPVLIEGEARGFWFFEASFPVQVLDATGNVLGEHYAQAQGEWMTTDFVPFISLVSFKNSPTATGFLVLKKDNPSGLPEHDQEVRYPIRFR